MEDRIHGIKILSNETKCSCNFDTKHTVELIHAVNLALANGAGIIYEELLAGLKFVAYGDFDAILPELNADTNVKEDIYCNGYCIGCSKRDYCGKESDNEI